MVLEEQSNANGTQPWTKACARRRRPSTR